MDLHVGYWDNDINQVTTRYYTSAFLRKASASEIYNEFNNCCPNVDPNKLLQISSDGPNVNLSFLNTIHERRRDNEMQELIYLGTCGLHTVHNGIKHGESATKWNLKNILSAIFKIFHESPSRRADYEKLVCPTKTDYPLQFCAHRWTENEPVCKRAQNIWTKMIEIVKFWKSLPKSKQPGRGKGENKSFDRLCSSIDDPLVPVKLQFFEEISKLLNSFLVSFQIDKSMAPFLADRLEKITIILCRKFIKKDILDEAVTTLRFIKMQITDKANQVNVKTVDLGFSINHELNQLKINNIISETLLNTF